VPPPPMPEKPGFSIMSGQIPEAGNREFVYHEPGSYFPQAENSYTIANPKPRDT
jgi:hypothetical protein